MVKLAGNASADRRHANDRLDAAKRAGADKKTIAQLQATYDVLRDKELSQTGGHRQVGE
ncbi:MAG: hypothetical protein ABI716_00015 [Candidatus Saccharibacteria bacterium]